MLKEASQKQWKEQLTFFPKKEAIHFQEIPKTPSESCLTNTDTLVGGINKKIRFHLCAGSAHQGLGK